MQTIILADDHPVTLSGVKAYVEKLGFVVLKACDNGIDAFNQINSLKPEYAILDLSMPGMNGLEVLEKIRRQNASIKIIMYTMYHEKTLFEKAVALKVNGYLLKEFAMEELWVCLDTLRYEKQWFSPKLFEILTFKSTDSVKQNMLLLTASERKIVSLIAEEKNSRQIADLLFISEKTVENHRSNVIKKLNLPQHKNSLLGWAISNKNNL